MFRSIEEMVVATAEAVRPAKQMTVSEAAAEYRKLNNVGSYVGPWKNEKTPYLVEPMDLLTSTAYRALVLIGSAQTGKTDIFLNWLLHSVICDPADMMLVQTSNATARDFSISKVDRLHRHSPEVGRRLVKHRNSDNTFDKRYQSGMIARLSWPTINELSGKSIPRLWLTDYDRMDQDVDGEGTPFDLGRTRTKSFKRFGMCVAESTPGFPITDPKWSPSSPHEAPPTEGITALYNRGDRRRWRWRCFQCAETFEPDFNLLDYPDSADPVECGEAVTMICPHCGGIHHHDENPHSPSKHEMNLNGRWVPEGLFWMPDGTLAGKPRNTEIASFWIKGVCAVFADWKTLVTRYREAEIEFEKTGSEGALKTTVNVDQGNAYLPKSQVSDRLPEELKARARDFGHKVVPPGVRFLIATIDVQKNRFVVQVHGFGAGGDIWIVDRFDIRYSKRDDPSRKGQKLWVDPAAHQADWELIYEEVIAKSYELGDGSGRHMPIRMTFSDSAGRDGFTTAAYNFWRWLRDNEDPKIAQALNRFMLLRGSAHKRDGSARVKVTFPNSERKEKFSEAKGEIPVLELQTDQLKDQLNVMLSRTTAGTSRINFPDWLDNNFYIELTVEVKNAKGVWENPKRYRNESWDLLAYAIAGSISPRIQVEDIDWSDPPGWAEEWALNDLLFDPTRETTAFEPVVRDDDFSKLSEALA